MAGKRGILMNEEMLKESGYELDHFEFDQERVSAMGWTAEALAEIEDAMNKSLERFIKVEDIVF